MSQLLFSKSDAEGTESPRQDDLTRYRFKNSLNVFLKHYFGKTNRSTPPMITAEKALTLLKHQANEAHAERMQVTKGDYGEGDIFGGFEYQFSAQ